MNRNYFKARIRFYHQKSHGKNYDLVQSMTPYIYVSMQDKGLVRNKFLNLFCTRKNNL